MVSWCCAVNANLDAPDGTPPAVEPIPDSPHVQALVSAFFPARDVIIEKSRYMLASWVAMAAVPHDLLFARNWPVMTLSRVESLVDAGGENSTMDSLHGKVRFMGKHLPPFLRRTPLEFKHLTIRNPVNGSHVKGFSATPSAGRGPKMSCDPT